MKPFEYFAPRTLTEAIETLARYNGQARVLAGGTNLVLNLKEGKESPRAVVNVKRIPELRGLAFNSHLTLGALTTVEDIHRSPVIVEHFPALAYAASTMASVQIRNLATVGGNLCNAAPSADLAPILIAFDAVARIAGPRGERRVPLEVFFTGPGTTVLSPGELLVAVEIPPWGGPAWYLKHATRTWMDIAVVGVACALRMDGGVCAEARVVLGAVAPTPLRVRRAERELVGETLTPQRIDRAAKIAAGESKPIDDVRGSAWYRRQMVEVLTRRGLMQLITDQ